MGQCGCADDFGHFKFRGITQTGYGWYVIELYAGCEYCDTPAGVQLTFYSDDNKIINCIDDVPDITVKLAEGQEDGVFLPIFDFHKLVTSDALDELGPPEDYATVKDLMGDMRHPVRMAAVDTINKTLKRMQGQGE